jgi:hypothetical protein
MAVGVQEVFQCYRGLRHDHFRFREEAWSSPHLLPKFVKKNGGKLIAIIVAATRFIVRADEKLTAFVELERAIHEFAVNLIT